MTENLDTVLTYHQRTKHHFQRYAAGPDGLDWANQPEAFREYAGSPKLALPLLTEPLATRFVDLTSGRQVPVWPLSLASIGALLELSLGLSAWKQAGGSRWALRCNPSSGNLHPTEAYLVVDGIDGVSAGVHHYLSRDHLLEQRCEFPEDESAERLPADSFLVGLSSIHWREAWKYGERAFRYCQHDAGHAIAALRYAAAALGWQLKVLGSWGDRQTASLLGLDRRKDFVGAELEQVDLIMQLTAASVASDALLPDGLPDCVRAGRWFGQANVLSVDHGADWPIVDSVAAACEKPPWSANARSASLDFSAPLASDCALAADALVRQRRSAQSFDGATGIDADHFFRMLDMTLPRGDIPPWDAVSWAPSVHLLLFVHRVDGLAPGLYLLLRDPAAKDALQPIFGRDFEWQTLPEAPGHLPIYRLLVADAREAAKTLSCHQDIAADGAFSLGMLAEFRDELSQAPWHYRRLLWETGMIGQVLYLEAEAAGLRGTGIGCFFDDAVHEMLGLEGQVLQSLYHFTVGGPLEDDRLQTLPPYAHLKGR